MSHIVIEGTIQSMTVDGVAWAPVSAGETCEQFVTRMYAQYLHRPPDPGPNGAAWWVEQCSSGAQTREQIEAAFKAMAPTPPNPNPVPPGTGTDLSDKVQHEITFQSGVAQGLYCRCSGGYVEIAGAAVAGAGAQKVRYTVNGGPEQSFIPSGADFRFKCPESTNFNAGTVLQTVLIIDGVYGTGLFTLQAVGAVGP